MDLWTTINAIPGVGPYLPYIMAAVTICAAICTVLPAPKADAPKAYVTVYKVLNWIALNLGHAKNAASVNKPNA